MGDFGPPVPQVSPFLVPQKRTRKGTDGGKEMEKKEGGKKEGGKNRKVNQYDQRGAILERTQRGTGSAPYFRRDRVPDFLWAP